MSLPVELRHTPFVNHPVAATEDRVVGTLDIEKAIQKGERHFEPGVLAAAKRGMLYIDEVNLMDDHVVDLLLDSAAMGMNIVEREGISFAHPARFILVGTMNPEEGELRPQLTDRFALSVDIRGIREARERVSIMERNLASPRLLHGDLHRWNVKVYRGQLGVLDFEDSMLGWPVQDIGTTLLYFYGDKDYPSNREAFRDGYSAVASWPERVEGEVDAFIAARNLVLANTVLQENLPELNEMAPRYFARVERRLRALLWHEGEFDSNDW